MMRNSVFITLFITSCAYQMWMVSGQNCTAPDQQPPYSNACIFHCIENLYDEKHCNVCSKNSHPINLNRSETLESILPYIAVRYDEKKDAIVSLPSCSGCVSEENKEEVHVYVEYVQPEELFEFYDLSHNLTVETHHINVNETIVERVHELYTNLTNRLDETKRWCVNALGIEEQYNKFKIAVENVADVESETAITDAIGEATTVTAPTDGNSETFSNGTGQHDPTQSNKTSNLMDNIMKNDDNESPTTTEVPEPTTVRVQNDTSKMRNMPSSEDGPSPSKKATVTMSANRPPLPDHHFHHSVTIITAVSLVLLSILIVSIAVIGFYVNRHRNMGAHLTSSRTYVFDQQN